jgi:ribosome-binding factor A
MGFKRAQKVGELILEEVSNILLREIQDPRIGFVTITHVKVSDDLRFATIFVSVMGEDEEKKSSLEGLQSASGFMRKKLGARLQLRCVPELVFKLDDSMEKSAKILTILSKLKIDSCERNN